MTPSCLMNTLTLGRVIGIALMLLSAAFPVDGVSASPSGIGTDGR